MIHPLLARLASVALSSVGLASIAPPAAWAQGDMRAHMEGCLLWSGPGNVAVRNDCSRPVTLMLMNFTDQQTVTTELPPGGRYTAAFEWNTDGFMFTACPVGYKPNLRFAVENKDTIGVSLYNCISGGPTS